MKTTIETIDDAQAFAQLKAEWNPLLEASSSACVFLTWEWLSTWWKHLSAGRKLSILAARRGSELVALAPLALKPRGWGSLSPFYALEFLAAGSVGSDYLDLIVRHDGEEEALDALSTHLIEKQFNLDLRQLRRGSSSSEALAARLSRRQGWSLVETKTEICPFIDLSGRSWDSYLASLGSQHRYNFNRRLKNLRKQFDVSFEPARTEAERREALKIVIELHLERWSGRGGSDGLHTRALLSFHEAFTRRALERGWLRLFVLRLDGKPAAALYGLRYGRVFYFYQSGFASGYARHSVGLVAMGLAIQSALAEGAEEYDLLHGSEAYKFQWARETRDLARLEIFSPSASGRIYRGAVELNRAAKRLARRVLPKTVAERIAAARRKGEWKELYAAQTR
jgi:CelD/BcsL family acetyltransferase involved in cellulose biosynthesis